MPRIISDTKQVARLGTSVPVANRSLQPSYKFINDIPKDFFSLRSVFNFHDALMQYTAHEANASAKETGERAEERYKDGIAILEAQGKLFSSIASTNILQSYQDSMKEFEEQSLLMDESGEGHADRVASKHDELTTSLLSGVPDAELRWQLKLALNNEGKAYANKAFDQELTKRAAWADAKLEKAMSDGALQLDKGITIDAVLSGLDAITSSIPDALPGKMNAILKVRQNILGYAADITAKKNPMLMLAELDRENGPYAQLTPEQRKSTRNSISLSLRDMAHEVENRQYLIALDEAIKNKGHMNAIMTKIAIGDYGFSNIISDSTLNDGEKKLVIKLVENNHEARLKEKEDRIRAEYECAVVGNYASSAGTGTEKNVWSEFFLDASYNKHDEEKILSGIEKTAAFCVEPNKQVCAKLISLAKSDDVKTMTKALHTFNNLSIDRPQIISCMSNEEREMMILSTTMLDSGDTIRDILDMQKIMMAPITKEENEMINSQLNDEAIVAAAKQVVNAVPGLESNIVSQNRAAMLIKKLTVKSRGRIDLAINSAIRTIGNEFGTTNVNGIVNKGKMWHPPEKENNPDFEINSSHRDCIVHEICTNAEEFYNANVGATAKIKFFPQTDLPVNLCIIDRGVLFGEEVGIYCVETNPVNTDEMFVKYTYAPLLPTILGAEYNYDSNIFYGNVNANLVKHLKTYGTIPEGAIDYKAASNIKISQMKYLASSSGEQFRIKNSDALHNYSVDLVNTVKGTQDEDLNANNNNTAKLVVIDK